MHISPKIDFGTYKPIIMENIHYYIHKTTNFNAIIVIKLKKEGII